jgi:hypothetical protein
MTTQPALSFPGDNWGQVLAEFQAARPIFLEAYLRQMGLSDLERAASRDRIPDLIRRVLPDSSAGFGLVGGFGIGKTCALAAMQRHWVEAVIDREMAWLLKNAHDGYWLAQAIKHGRFSWLQLYSWVNWPTAIDAQRAKLFVHNMQYDVETWIQDKLLSNKVTVILDDIGAERVTAQDWAGEVLGRVIDERLRWGRPTLWTSNLDQVALIERYGARVYSRLQALAPPIYLPKLPDLRRGSTK